MNTDTESANYETPQFNNNNNIVESYFDSKKNTIIIILTGLLVLSFLGINLLNRVGDVMETITSIFGPLITQILSAFGYTAGTVLGKSTDVATDVVKTGLDVANESIQSVAGILKDASRSNIDQTAKFELDNVLNNSKYNYSEPDHDSSVNPIQKPITSSKQTWCLVGEYEGKRGCVGVNDDSKCMSGQTFPSRQLCMNPTRTVYTNP